MMAFIFTLIYRNIERDDNRVRKMPLNKSETKL